MSADPSLLIPCLPDTAPFTPEQRAYLNGFLAGLFSRVPAPEQAHASAQEQPQLMPLTILFGSQTGNAENLARRAAKEAGKRGFAPTVHDLAKYNHAQLASEARLLLITSTYGDGEPPDAAKAFWNFLSGTGAPNLANTRYVVCALGDSNYPRFCAFGKAIDQRLTELSAHRLHACGICDVDFEAPFAQWLNQALSELAGQQGNGVAVGQPIAATGAVPDNNESPKYSRASPFPATLQVSRTLNARGSSKETRHIELALTDSDLRYEAGDALGVFPTNCRELVEALLTALRCPAEASVPGRAGLAVPLQEALLRHYEITRVSPAFLAAMAERSQDERLRKLTVPDVNGELTTFLRGRDVLDLLRQHPKVSFGAAEFVGLLKPLSPRLYSIASSPKLHAGQVHLTVSVVRYESLNRKRKGVCSTFLAERVESAAHVPVFVQANRNFRLPAKGETPIIMVGPGTGVAPFRAFLHERRATGASGRNWLFFGDQRASTDFLYGDEFHSMLQDGSLTRLDTAFSRDQAEKIYVQHRMREHAKELFAWLEDGAHFYVCGDAARMARDVEAALREVIQQAGALDTGQTTDYVARLKTEGRYQRDVY